MSIEVVPKSACGNLEDLLRPDCLNVKSEEERVVYKGLNSTETLIQKTTMEAPHETLCITSDWMFTIRRSATA